MAEEGIYLVIKKDERMYVPNHWDGQQMIFFYNSEKGRAIAVAGEGYVNSYERYTEETKRRLFVTGGAVEMLEKEIRNSHPTTVIKKISPELFDSIETIATKIQSTEKELSSLRNQIVALVKSAEE